MSAMRIRLSEERKAAMLRSIHRFHLDRLDREIGTLQAEMLLEFFVKELGAPVYNQAIQDAHAFLQSKLEDLEGEFYEPEEPYDR